jgi:hypothetical protein
MPTIRSLPARLKKGDIRLKPDMTRKIENFKIKKAVITGE